MSNNLVVKKQWFVNTSQKDIKAVYDFDDKKVKIIFLSDYGVKFERR